MSDVKSQLQPHANISLTWNEFALIPCVQTCTNIFQIAKMCNQAGYQFQQKGELYRIVEK